MTLDISNLSGTDLFDALKSGEKFKVDPLFELVGATSILSEWKDVALVLKIHQTTCKGCGSFYCVPNDRILLHRQHPRLGDHYSDITSMFKDPEAHFKDLPLYEEPLPSEVPCCQFCWNLEHVINAARWEE